MNRTTARRLAWSSAGLIAAAALVTVLHFHPRADNARDQRRRAENAVAAPAASPAVESAGAVASAATSPSAPIIAGEPPVSPPRSGERRLPASRAGDLFAYIPAPAHAAAWEKSSPAPTREIHYVRVSPETAAGKTSPFWKAGGGGELPVRLPDGTALAVTVKTSELLGPDRFVASGAVAGRPLSRVALAYSDGEMSGMIESVEDGAWQLRAIGGGVAQFFKVDPARVPACGGEPKPAQALAARVRAWRAAERSRAPSVASSAPTTTAGATASAAAASSAPVAGGGAPPALAANEITKEIRVLMAVTDDVAAQYPSASIQSQVDAAIRIANDDFAASQIPVVLRLAGLVTVNYNEFSSGSGQIQTEALDRLADPTDGQMDDVPALRNQYAADLVVLFLRRVDVGSAGLAYLLDDAGGLENEAFAYAVVEFNYITISHVTTHEIGHTLGCSHDRANADLPGAFPYSYGHRFTGANGGSYCTIMAYTGGTFTRLGYFSNPAITAPAPVSRPVGIAEGLTGQADNARTIRQTAFEVSQYRFSPQTPVNAGTMVAVSTQAYVGSGPGEDLIGGVVLTGTQKKTILFRAVGPTLGAAGVAGALTDPVLWVFSTSGAPVQVAMNDNWAPELASQFVQAGASPFAAGSRDSAVVLTLDPGNYTANILGAGGASGRALVEVYEVGRGTPGRVIALSTRGYVTKQQTMVAGFVITPDASDPTKTKRVLIRGLGPTLAAGGFTNALDDPIMSLYDGNSQKILTNDDWTGDTAGVDTSPEAKSHSAAEIFATGFAPLNRRDAVIYVDLLPGLYTAIVEPFSNETQPATPGVAIVEVYEIGAP